MMPLVTRKWALKVPLWPTWIAPGVRDVAVGGVGGGSPGARGRRRCTRSRTRSGASRRRLRARPRPLTVTVWPPTRPWFGRDLDGDRRTPSAADTPGAARTAAPGQGGHVAAAAHHRYMPTTSETGSPLPGRTPGDASFHRGSPETTRPRPRSWSRGRTPVPRAARLI